ncbi:hypothetical protein TREVI0001_0590 [Treponema vincentii ATCC 35580]|uniref:Uncharacterized protein n=1 Tax=Treponema vincentii ATCC 35580 TaxID=596324 RepID=C8PMH6_9SPIR|nr:hypothetical protein TREVI0001_0590 [Treponema vincentii ATCC 35580]
MACVVGGGGDILFPFILSSLLFMTNDYIRLLLSAFLKVIISGAARILLIYKKSITLFLIAVQQALESMAVTHG